jgi:uncharacterized small protein (DUF1192 family)
MSDLELTMMRRVGELNKENAALKAEVERTGAENSHLHKGIYSLSLNVAQLKDEVERLTKAGDAFVLLLEDEGYDMESVREVETWNAAKEGKPRA